MRTQYINALTSLTLVLASACESSSPDRREVDLSFSSQSSASAASAAAANFDVTVSGGGNTVVITRAQLVLRDIKLKPTQEVCVDGGSTEPDPCAAIHVGPTLVDLPLTTDAITSISASVPAGTYRRAQLKIHKPSDDTEDAAFVTANPAFADISIRVEGTFNGQAFVFTSALTENIELTFNPALVIDTDNQNVTVQVDVGSWFTSGTTVIDPTTANDGQPNENLVRNNIRASLRAIEDNDRNGR